MASDAILAQLVTALQQIALELAEQNGRAAVAQPAPPPASVPLAAPQAFSPIGWTCPDHHQVKVVPAGISHKRCLAPCPGSAPTCNAYDTFAACPVQGCTQKPPKPTAPTRAMPPGQLP